MRYTAYNNPVIEERIERDINLITENIIKDKARWGIISLILYGGFARGEGSIEVSGDNVRPLNDYDFIAVTKYPVPLYLSFKKFVMDLNSQGKDYNVDMVIRPLWFMKRYHPSVFYYELKNSGRVLWGKDVLRVMPEILQDSIPFLDAISTLFNRLMSLLTAYAGEDKRYAIYQCNKAILTCMEILLLNIKKYHWSYRERFSIFKSVFKKSYPELSESLPEFTAFAERATQFKLFPDFTLYPGDDLWERTAYIYFRILKLYIGELKALKAPFYKTIPSWAVFKLRKKDFSLRFNFRSQPYIFSYLAGYEWLKAWIEKSPSDKIRKYLGSIDSAGYTDDFLEIRDKIIYNWKKSSFVL